MKSSFHHEPLPPPPLVYHLEMKQKPFLPIQVGLPQILPPLYVSHAFMKIHEIKRVFRQFIKKPNMIKPHCIWKKTMNTDIHGHMNTYIQVYIRIYYLHIHTCKYTHTHTETTIHNYRPNYQG